jgi:oligopeptide transport system ATP-binding protein
MTAGSIIAEPLWTFYPQMESLQVEERTRGMMKMVGLLPNQINRYPHEFSGGQCQRIGIARSLVLNPKLLICDEPVSALDVSIQAQIINLLMELQKDLGLSYLLISHDLAVIRHLSNRVAIMYMGRIVEQGETEDIFNSPLHPYTEALLAAIPGFDTPPARIAPRDSDPPSPAELLTGCPFQPRCPYRVDICRSSAPALTEKRPGHFASCHLNRN